MIVGIGIDITDIERIKRNLKNVKFLNKIYTKNEIEYLKSRKFNSHTAAGIFAAKEAVSKCLGSGFKGLGPLDIEILKDEKGKPVVILLGKALYKASELNITHIHLSISHVKEYAVAYCVAECLDNPNYNYI